MDTLVSWFGGKQFMRMLMDCMETTDQWMRVGMFIELIERGKHPSEAAKEVNRIFWNYSDLSAAEKAIFRSVILFYSFMRKNTEFVADAIVRDPSRVLGWLRLQQDMQREAYETTEPELFSEEFNFGRIPFWFLSFEMKPPNDSTGIRGIRKFMPLSPLMNYWDLIQLVSSGSSMDLNYFVQQMSPIVTVPGVLWADQIPFQGIDVERQEISIDVITYWEQMGVDNMFGPKGSGAYIQYEQVPWSTQMDPKKVSLERMGKLMISPKSGPMTGAAKFVPADAEAGKRYFLLSQVAMPAALQQIPGIGFAAQRASGRPGKMWQNLDRADVLRNGEHFSDEELRVVGLLSGELMKMAENIGWQTKSMEDIYIEAEKTKVPPNEVYMKYWTGDQNDGILIADYFLKPENVPSEYYLFQMIGLRYITDAETDIMLHRQWQEVMLELKHGKK